jgi:hypothetical protein
MLNHVARNRQNKLRNDAGGVFVLVVACCCLVIVPLVIIASQFGMYTVDKYRVQNVVDAAGLLAANDMSRIVINDPNFGYVALSNYAPIGKATAAADGEPLPVTGINTLVGTIRQNTILANDLNNTTMATLAENDRADLQQTIDTLNSTLSQALSGKSKNENVDIQGTKIDPLQDVTKYLKANLPANVELESIKLSNGWLKDGGRTTIPVMKPIQLAQVKPEEIQQDFFKPFIKLPAFGKAFTFAGLGETSTIVHPKNFQPLDRNHICSIVKIEAVMKVHRPETPYAGKILSEMPVVTCSQPYTLPDVGAGGVMTLRFTSGPVAGLTSWSDFLSDTNFRDRQLLRYDVAGGDYQIDTSARKRRLANNYENTTAHEFSENLYYWLRSGHLTPQIESVRTMLNDQFTADSSQIYAYEFTRDGTISRRTIDKDPFPPGVTSDAQFSTVADTRIQEERTPIVIFRNNVKRLGTISGGKHGGQPLAGNPINWCELQEFGGGEQLAAKLGRGRLGTGLVMTDPNYIASAQVADPVSNLFQSLTGQTTQQPRKSFYSGGLALDIEIGGCRPSTAFQDLERQKKMKR